MKNEKKIFVSILRKKNNDTLVVDLTASKEDVHLFIIQISLMFKKKAYQKLSFKYYTRKNGSQPNLQKLEEKHPRA